MRALIELYPNNPDDAAEKLSYPVRVKAKYHNIFLRILSRQNWISSFLAFQAELDVVFTKVQFCQRNNARHLSGSKNGLLGFV
jgi:hypothetical protein